MKPIIILILMFAIIPSALALYGGETWLYHFDYCDELRVNITATDRIDNGEYTIHNDCNETYENYFICNCTDDYHLNVSFKVNAVNNYQFSFNYDYTKEEVKEDDSSSDNGGSSSSSGGRGGYTFYGLTNGSQIIYLRYADAFTFYSKGNRHTVVVLRVFNDTIKLRVRSTLQDFVLKEGETKELDTDSNGKNDFSATLKEVTSKYGGVFTFTILEESSDKKPAETKAVADIPDVVEEVKEDIVNATQPEIINATEEPVQEETKQSFLLFIIIAVVTLGIIAVIIILSRDRT